MCKGTPEGERVPKSKTDVLSLTITTQRFGLETMNVIHGE